MRTDIECLIDLDSVIKCPFVDARKAKRIEFQADEPKSWTPFRLYSDRIGHRFPGARLELVQRLAEANWSRFQRIQSDKEKNISESRKTGIEMEEGVAFENDAVPATEKGSSFHDSGLGTSLATGSAYAETTMSYRQESIDHSIKIPPLTPEAKRGKPFECLACGKQVKIANNSLWKKHLFNDLKPWICHDVSCRYGTEPFESREDWIQHLALEHELAGQWHSIECPLCLDSTGHGKVRILKHLSSHFEEISLSSLPAGVESDCDSESYSASTISKGSRSESLPEPDHAIEEHVNRSPSETAETQPQQTGLHSESGYQLGQQDIESDAPLPYYPGFNAHNGLETVGHPRGGEDLFVDEKTKDYTPKTEEPLASIQSQLGNLTYLAESTTRNTKDAPTRLQPAPGIKPLPEVELPSMQHFPSIVYNCEGCGRSYDQTNDLLSHKRDCGILRVTMIEPTQEEPYIIKCICDFTDDDGNTIYCDKCDTWQHIECFYPDAREEALREDFEHWCADCKPRPLDRQRAMNRVKSLLSSKTGSGLRAEEPPASRMHRQGEEVEVDSAESPSVQRLTPFIFQCDECGVSFDQVHKLKYVLHTPEIATKC
ncbi:hypothetical protein CkaCkLH20_11014 [Colletotrichum karsti]|uniref:C2H2-type domain-containing protein n=1 Tax=Colletotrichum karsti TaxID=1095194 RepID=A0A9P6LGE9_9PEZI|nr:uncharacterized protein CkaCkLH20_11014 [Colletotrichum karsti]KAF9871367.1 hypothetical protein CkaCkLH20_11014 [Colletotrichum karsti]